MRRIAIALLCATGAFANPQGGTVVSGAATISVAGKTLTVDQTTPRAIVNWQRFENTASETIRFNQPGVTSVTLNRVVGIDPSLISGALQANGQLFVINPNGVVFGPTARVNVSSLVASTLNITDADFNAGRYILVQDPGIELSSVINRGSITAAQGGTVALIAPIVDNSGTIVAAAGRVILTAETHATIDTFDPNPPPDSAIGRAVRMPEVGLTPLLEEVVNTASLAPADRVVRLGDGTVFLRGAGGVIANGGTINVDGTASADAGTVDLTALRGMGFAPGGAISAVAPAPRAGTGRVTLRTTTGDYFIGQQALPGRHVIRAGTAEVRDAKFVRSSAAGAFEVGGGKVEMTGAVEIGAGGAPVRVNAAFAQIAAEGDMFLLADLDLGISIVRSEGHVSVTAGRSILLAPGAAGEAASLASPVPVAHVIGRTVELVAGSQVGGPGDPLAVADRFGLTVTAPGGQNIVTALVDAGVLPPPAPGTGLIDTLPVPRPPYVPPEDPAAPGPPPPVPAPPVAAPVVVSAGGALDAVIAVAPAPDVAAQPAVVGGRDNILLPTLRTTTVKGSDQPAESSGDDVVVVKDDEDRRRQR